MKKLFVGIFVIVLLCCISVYSYIKIEINRLEKDLKDYLIREGHYNDSDILSIEGKFGKMPRYAMFVKFKDEPENTYVYTDRGTGEWKQIGPSATDLDQGKNYKHIEKK